MTVIYIFFENKLKTLINSLLSYKIIKTKAGKKVGFRLKLITEEKQKKMVEAFAAS